MSPRAARLAHLLHDATLEVPDIALHTSLSALGYVRLQSERQGEATSLLLESLDLLCVEYDLNVVRQVRKLRCRAFVEVRADFSAETVRQDDDYYWRTASHGENYGYIN